MRFQWYTDFPNKVTGEVNCFHLEAKCEGSAALRRTGKKRKTQSIPQASS